MTPLDVKDDAMSIHRPLHRTSSLHGLPLALVLGTSQLSTAQAAPPAAEVSQGDELSIYIVLMMPEVADGRKVEIGMELYEKQLPGFLEEHGVREAPRGDEAELIFRLTITQPDPKSRTYLISSVSIYPGGLVEGPERACLQCGPAEVIAEAFGDLEKAVGVAFEHRANVEPEGAEPPPPELPEPAPEPRVRKIGPVGYVGISSLALGVGSLIAGGVFLARGVVVEPDTGALFLNATDYRPLGAALLGAGAGMMVLGSVMVGVDAGVLLPRRRTRARAQLDGVALASGGRTGVFFAGRF